MTEDMLKLSDLVSTLDELSRRNNHPFTGHKPLPKQEQFHRSEKQTRVNTGGNRSGKSRSSAQEILWWVTESHPYLKTPPHPRVWVISPEYRTLYEGVWIHLKFNIPDWEVLKIGPKVPGWDLPTYVEFKKGGRIDFISAEGGDDRTKLQAAAIDLVVIDEEVGFELMTEIEARLLDRDGRIVVGATLVKSEEWILRLIDAAEAGDPDVDHFEFDTRDNPYISEKARKRFIAKLPDDEYEVRILGKGRRTRGLIYSKFLPNLKTDQRHGHLIEPFDIPQGWTKAMCLDGGYRVAAALWMAITPPPSKCILYREMYLPYSEARDWVDFIYSNEGWVQDEKKNPYFGWVVGPEYEEISLRLVDPSDFSHQKDGSVGPATRLSENYGLELCPGTNDKGQNILDVRTLIEHNKLFVFNTLTNFVAEIKKYRIKPIKDGAKKDLDHPADRPIKKHDHLMNCLEYLASQQISYVAPKTEEESITEQAMMDDEEINWLPGEAGRTQYYRIQRERMRIMRGQEERGD